MILTSPSFQIRTVAKATSPYPQGRSFSMTTTSQQQSQKETNENNFVGIDVAKDELVVHVLPMNQQLTVPNSVTGIKELAKLRKEINPVQIVLEAIGGLERELLTNLVANGFAAYSRRPKMSGY